MKSCFFIGHRDTPQELYPQILKAIDMLIMHEGVTIFYVGNYGRFDHMVAHAITQIKKDRNIVAMQLLPYHPAEHPISIPDSFDGSFYPPDMEHTPRKFAIIKANQYMVDHVDHLVTYVWHPASNARNLLEYAKRREKTGTLKIWNLYINGIY